LGTLSRSSRCVGFDAFLAESDTAGLEREERESVPTNLREIIGSLAEAW
jgi:hypothetical protein